MTAETATPREVTDSLDPARAAALQVALDLPGPPVATGDAMPPFFHQLYFWTPLAPGALGRDGHSARGGLIPDLGLPRRMWAGGRLQFAAPLRLGLPAHKLTQLDSVTRKTGRSGPLAFVTLRHDIRQDGRLCVTEFQDLVFRDDPRPGAAAPTPETAPPGQGEDHRRFDTTLLFRYSALTLNGHRIHYDADYCRTVEGYAGPVVHGPLLAQLLMLKARARLGALRRFDFRALSAVTVDEAVQLEMDGRRLWVAGPGGRLCMTARAEAG